MTITVSKKLLILLVALVVALCCAIGGTVAWLYTSTESVINTFTYGNISITLTESDNLDLKIIPGTTIKKDPLVTVEQGSEPCYLFVKIDKNNYWSDKITYDIADGWTELSGAVTGTTSAVYYRQVNALENEAEFSVIENNLLTVSDELTKEEIPAFNPTLTFTAYAVQSANGDSTFTPEEAWNIAY